MGSLPLVGRREPRILRGAAAGSEGPADRESAVAKNKDGLTGHGGFESQGTKHLGNIHPRARMGLHTPYAGTIRRHQPCEHRRHELGGDPGLVGHVVAQNFGIGERHRFRRTQAGDSPDRPIRIRILASAALDCSTSVVLRRSLSVPLKRADAVRRPSADRATTSRSTGRQLRNE